LLKEAEAADRKAAAAQVKAEAKTEIAAAVQAPVVQVAPAAPRQDGESTRKIWKGRIVNIKDVPRDYLLIFIGNIPADKMEAAVNTFARSTRGNIPVPGIQFYEEKSLAVR
jgi:hypothetical protein